MLVNIMPFCLIREMLGKWCKSIMKNLFITNLHKKDVNHFTTNTGLFLRRKLDKPFKKACNLFTNANIVRVNGAEGMTDEEYYFGLSMEQVQRENYTLSAGKRSNNIVVERYPSLEKDESYIFVGNHTFPEDIETMLNIIDRNTYLILGSVEVLKYNPEMYLSYLNGMVVFDILNAQMRKALMPKMERVLRTNSVLIFPEGSHNYHPSNLINPLFDGPINLALRTGKKIVPVCMVRDEHHRVSYIDVGNPIDVTTVQVKVQDYYPRENESEKYRIKALSAYLRDKMASSVYYLMARHIDPLKRAEWGDIEQVFIDEYVENTFHKLKWRHDVFDAEYLVKKTQADKEYEEIIRTLGKLMIAPKVLRETGLNSRYWIRKFGYLEREYVAGNMRKRFEDGDSINVDSKEKARVR